MIGFLRNDNGLAKNAPVGGQHSGIEEADIFSSGGINPTNPGSWQSYRSAPVVPEARCFDSVEAQLMSDLANDQEQAVSSTRKGYRALKRLTASDTKINSAHEAYRKAEASEELKRQGLKSGSARYLHSLRPSYAKLGHQLTNAAQLAEQRIAQLMGS